MSPSSIPTKSLPITWKVILLLLAGWMLFNFLQTLHWVYLDYSPVPVMDYWRVPQHWATFREFHWSTLWTQHNEHRILFPEIVYVADMVLLQGRMYLPIAVNGLCYFGIWLLLVWAVYSQDYLKTPVREVALLTAGVVLTWRGCSTVIATPFQLAFTMLQFASAVSFLLLAKLVETGRSRFLGGVIAAAFIANLSSATGIVLWFVLIAAALLLRVSLRHIVILISAAVLTTFVYFIGYHFLPSAMGSNIHYPVRALEFLCSYLSMPFGSFSGPNFGFVAGFLNLLLMTACFVFARRRGLLKSRLALLLFGMYAFTVCSAVLTALGRMQPEDVTFRTAKAWRYSTMPTVGWSLLAVALVWLAGEARSRRWSAAVALGLCAFFGYGFVKARFWAEDNRLDIREVKVTEIMFQNNVFDTTQVRTIFPDAEFVRVTMADLKESGRMMFAQGHNRLIGKSISQLSPSLQPCPGAITRVYPVAGGVELLGWSDSRFLTNDHAVLFVDTNGTVVGFGNHPPLGLPETLKAWDTPASLSFIGFVAVKKALGPLSVYVQTSRRGLQPLDGKIDVPAFFSTGSTTDLPPLPGIVWHPDPNWTPMGYPASPYNGLGPDSASIYGSWSGSDAKTGIIRSEPFSTPSNHCLVLPVLHGFTAYRQSVELRDSDTGLSLAKIPMLDGQSIWERWRIPIPSNTHRIVVEADDEGWGPNQWTAVAAPELCP